MISIHFSEAIDIHNTRNYFENFYSMVWKANFGQTVDDWPLDRALDTAIKEYGGISVVRRYHNAYQAYRYVAKFESEEDLVVFKLKFS